MNTIPKIYSTALFLLTACLCHSQHYNEGIEKLIKEVENNLATKTIYSNDLNIPKNNINERMKQLDVKAVSIAVIKDYKIEWVRAYGYADVNEKREADSQTLFQAASISKSINSLAFMKLVQQDKLDLDKDINLYLKSWKFPYGGGSKIITARQLLSHTGGLGVSGFPGYERGTALPSVIQILDGIPPASTPPIRSVAKPGKKFAYSGGGTTISQLLLTDITGDSYEDFVRREVLEPLGMSQSKYILKNDTLNVASGYYSSGKSVKGKYHIYPELAAAALWTTPSELANYIIECQLSLKDKSNKVVTAKYMKERFKPVISLGKDHVALGLFLANFNGTYYFNHNGGNEGFTCAYYGSMENGNGVVVMTNTDNGSFMMEVCNSVARVYNWEGFYKPVFVKTMQPDIKTLQSYTGSYRNEIINSSIILENDNLYLKPDESNDKQFRISFIAGNRFVVPDYSGGLEYTIDIMANGKNYIKVTSDGEEIKVIKD